MNITCLNCGWVHFEVSRENANDNVNSFNTYFDTLSTKEQSEYYGGRKSDIKHYEHCNRCGNTYKNFRDSVEGDCPSGCTIGPIISRLE